jgi:hypothetical protein
MILPGHMRAGLHSVRFDHSVPSCSGEQRPADGAMRASMPDIESIAALLFHIERSECVEETSQCYKPICWRFRNSPNSP